MCSNFQLITSSGNLPGGVLVGLLKRHWPGLYKENPEDPNSLKKLAMRWEDYEAAQGSGYMETVEGESFKPSCAEVVVHKFWVRTIIWCFVYL
jgi:hypothetical protein